VVFREQNICRNARVGEGEVSQSEFKRPIYENRATISDNCKNTAVVSVLLVGVIITPGVNQKTKIQKVAEW